MRYPLPYIEPGRGAHARPLTVTELDAQEDSYFAQGGAIAPGFGRHRKTWHEQFAYGTVLADREVA